MFQDSFKTLINQTFAVEGAVVSIVVERCAIDMCSFFTDSLSDALSYFKIYKKSTKLCCRYTQV